MGTAMDIYSILKDLIHQAKEANVQPIVDKAMDFQIMLFEIKEENDNLKNELRSLREQIKTLNNVTDLENKLIPQEEPCYTLKGDTANRTFCATCWSTNNRLVQMGQYGSSKRCPICHTIVNKINLIRHF